MSNLVVSAPVDSFMQSADQDAMRSSMSLGTAATTASTDYATAAQGSKADSAVQPGSLAAIATSGSASDLSTGTVPRSTLPVPTSTLLGGVQANAGSAGQFVNGINTSTGALTYSTPSGGGDVTGPASATDANIALFDGTTGKVIKDGGVGVTGLSVQSAGTPSVRALGTTSTTACAGDDSRVVAGGTALQPAGNGSSLTGITATQVGLGNVTNDTQTKAAIVPNTAPSAGGLLIGNAGGTAYGLVAMSGDATIASTGALTIANSAVTNAKMANMAAHTFKMRNTNSTGAPEDGTATQATALLDAFVGDSGSGGTKGMVPAPATGDASKEYVLKANGSFGKPWVQIITESATSRTLSASDLGCLIRCTNASGCSITFNTSVFASDQWVMIEQAGALQVTLVEGSGVTLNNVSTLKTRVQYSVIGVIFSSSTVGTVFGDTE